MPNFTAVLSEEMLNLIVLQNTSKYIFITLKRSSNSRWFSLLVTRKVADTTVYKNCYCVAVFNNAISLQGQTVLIRCSVRGTLHTSSQTSISQYSLYLAELHFAVGDLPEIHIFGSSFGNSNHSGFKTFKIYNKSLGCALT